MKYRAKERGTNKQTKQQKSFTFTNPTSRAVPAQVVGNSFFKIGIEGKNVDKNANSNEIMSLVMHIVQACLVGGNKTDLHSLHSVSRSPLLCLIAVK